MAEYTYTGTQTVAENGTVLFNDVISRGNGCIYHRTGSGSFQLSGKTKQCRALYSVDFHGNMAISTGGTVNPITLALAIDGDVVQSTEMEVTPASVGDFFNVSAHTRIEIPRCICGATLTVVNTSTQSIDVSNVNIVISKLA